MFDPSKLPTLTLLGALLLIGCQETVQDSTPIARQPRSVLLLTLDTTRADHLQPYRSEHQTPNLDRLAREGIVMENAFAVSPLTNPTHASLLTGLNPPQHGVRTNGRHRLPSSTTTLAEHFSAHGFRTAAFLSAAVLERRYGLDQGFDLYDDGLRGAKLREARMVSERPATPTVDAARRWLDGLDTGEKFFLWVHLFDPHASYAPPEPYAERHRDHPYRGEISYMDAEIGRLLDHPALAPDQDVVVTAIADHGESLHQHGEATHGLLAYDATLHIPWIVRLPEGPRGLRFSSPVSQVDLLPTLLDLQGFADDEPAAATPSAAADGVDGIDGISLVPYWSPSSRPEEILLDLDERDLYAESLDPQYLYGWEALRVLRQGPWKYIAAPSPELYRWLDDPGEERNLIDVEASRAEAMARRLDTLARPAAAPAERLPLDDDVRAKLESLGYTAVTQTLSNDLDEPLDPKDVIDLHHTMQQAEGLMAEGRLDTARKLLREILRRDPRNHQALVHLARRSYESGDTDTAVAILQQGLAYYPGDTTLSLSLAGIEARRGRHDIAVELGRLALDSDPTQLQTWLLVADNLQAAGRREELPSLYDEALPFLGEEAQLHARFGLMLADSDDPRGQPVLRRALELGVDDPAPLHDALAGLLTTDGRSEEAAQQRRLAEQARQSGSPGGSSGDESSRPGAGPGGGSANAEAESLARQGKLQEARAIWQRLTEETPDDAAPFGNLATLALQRGDWTTAKGLAEQAVALDDSLAPSWNTLAYALEELGQTAQAISAYERALAADPTYGIARFNLGLLYKKGQDFQRAAEVFEALLRSEPDHWNAHFELILLYAGPLGDPLRARPHVVRNLEAAPDHPKAPLLRELLGRIDQATGAAAPTPR